ncbi:MAG: hypothetical protein IJC38_00355 [Erysipelotrichaceae bacterium]|nr:hypothetical protein [Erysipelotrichaceae bacterium]
MKKNQFLVCCFAMLALVLLVSQEEKPEMMVSKEMDSMIEIVLKNNKNQLIPLTVQSGCTNEVDCLNESLFLMSKDYDGLYSTIPVSAAVQLIECENICRIDFTSEILEFEPKHLNQMKQVLHFLLKDYPDVLITVEGKEDPRLQLDSSNYLNATYFLDEDYHRGYLYQMFMIEEIQNQKVAVPVVVYSSVSNPVEVIELYYGTTTSVQFDNLHFRTVELIDGEPLEVRLSQECMINQSLNDELVLPILYSLQYHTNVHVVKIVVDGVLVKEVDLDDLNINEFVLSK